MYGAGFRAHYPHFYWTKLTIFLFKQTSKGNYVANVNVSLELSLFSLFYFYASGNYSKYCNQIVKYAKHKIELEKYMCVKSLVDNAFFISLLLN